MQTFFLLCAILTLFHLATCKFWVSSRNGRLVYKTTRTGDRIIDFSSVGYMGKDAEIPNNIPIHVTVSPSSSSSDGVLIQQAIDNISSLPVDTSTGFRGVIQLTSGTFDVRGHSFNITSSGVVLRGNGTIQTVLLASALKGGENGTSVYPLFRVQSPEEVISEAGRRASIVSNVPSGADHVVVDSCSGLKSGDAVLVVWPQTYEWISMMNMTTRWGNFSTTSVERRITRIHRNKIYLDIRVPFRIDLSYLNASTPAYLVKVEITGRIERIGLENFKAVQEKVLPYGGGSFLNIGHVQDSWIRSIVAYDFGGDTMTLSGKRITVDNVQLVRTIPSPPLGAKPADLAIDFPGSQILVKNSVIVGGNTEFNYMTRNGANGPNVFFNSTGYGRAHAQPHSHFATGILYDNMKLPNGSIDLIRREFAHHGYTSAYSVVWNSTAQAINVISPPKAVNWAIGCSGNTSGNTVNDSPGIIDSHGIQSNALSSLYLAQKTAILD